LVDERENLLQISVRVKTGGFAYFAAAGAKAAVTSTKVSDSPKSTAVIFVDKSGGNGKLFFD
jgi:hypothetical protein